MCVDVVDFRGVALRLTERDLHRAHGALATLRWRGDVKRIVRGPVAGQLGVDAGAPGARMALRLQDDDAAALAHDEAVAVAVEGPRGPFRLVVAGGKRFHRGETG